MRARFAISVVVALGILATGALGIAITLATSDSAKWPVWLRPYHRWGWWAVLALLLAAAILAVWQYSHQFRSSSVTSPTTAVVGSGAVAGRDATITGGHGATAGRDVNTVIGGSGQTAGGSIINIGWPSPAQHAPIPGADVQWPTPDRTISNLPPRNPTFTGRDELLTRLDEQLREPSAGPGRPVAVVGRALYGLGGVGKTQLALEYAHRHATDYDVIWWIPAESSLTISASLARLALRLGLAPQENQEELVTGLLDALRTRDRWLLVFDNADEPDDLIQYQPGGGGGQVLVTSRNPAWGALARPIHVDVLDRDESVELLLGRISDHDPASADLLAEQLGDLPLALEQAAAYLEETGMPLASYLAAYQRRREQLLTMGRAVAYQGQVDTTWQLSTDRLAQTAPAGIDLLRSCAFLAPEAIPLDLFTTEPDRLPAALAKVSAEEGEAGVQEAAGACYRYSLVARDHAGIRVHRLVQEVVRAQMVPADRQALTANAMELVAAAFPSGDLMEPARWPRCAQLLPHLLAAADHAQAAGLATAATATGLLAAGSYLLHRADYQTARDLLERALVAAEAPNGGDQGRVGAIHNELGLVLRVVGDLAGARMHLERALEIGEVALGPDHQMMASILHNLGLVLRSQGDLAGARIRHEHAVRIAEATYGPEDPRIAPIVDHLGGVLRAQGDLGGARIHLERAVGITEAALGSDHLQLGISLHNLGRVLLQQGDLASARASLERALSITGAALGPEHPHTGVIFHSLGRVLLEQGDLAGARVHVERALSITQTALGPDHQSTGSTLHTLGRVLHAQGDLAGARASLERALSITEAALGPRHPSTEVIMRSLAKL